MKRLLNIELDDVTTQKLLDIATRHCKLALGHTSPERREAIKAEIVALIEERSQILASYTL
ncbi:hypothetical protein [Paenibacillus dendritiformis]|uniref:Uncharacterized protein n=1 Tax=Paenibacillus dendritiformis C454 TaxID=1131935 RepID=H3SNF7_9BACL|nr:hypothetical protein [Paenibacillus dendritiformis]EHQ59396.1 hypothetical protein PDENDC454_25536 [Paenibacillus dendritiformis C454]CAH8768631.1 hypothetical protein H7S4_001326 [Paenibacillus dendritiformis]